MAARDSKGKFVKGSGGGGKRAPKGSRRVQLITKFDLIGDWEAAMKASNLKLDKAIETAIRQESALAERMMKQNLQRGGQPALSPFKPLSPWTIAARRLSKPSIKGTKPLIARGDLFGAITHVVEGSGKETVGFVGVLRTAKGNSPGGPYLANIGAIQEFGKTIVIRMTPKMQRFLAVLAKAAGMPAKPQLKKGKGNVTSTRMFLVLHIPARPFVRPTFRLWSRDADTRFAKRVSILTGGKLGSP